MMMMKLSFVFLCLSLATLLLAAIPSAEKERSSLSSSKQAKNDGSASSAAGKFSQATKKSVKGGKPVPKKRWKKRTGATKGIAFAGAGEESLTVTGSGKSSQEGSAALRFFPKVLVELISGYLEGYSVVFTRDWSAVYSWYSVAVNSERHYLITRQNIQASSHGDGVKMNIGSPDLSNYDDFHSSRDGRSVFFTGRSQEQNSISSLKKTARWLVQETGTKSLKNVILENDETSVSGSFMLSANGKALLSTRSSDSLITYTTSVYQIKEHGKAASASKKGDFDGYAVAVSRNGNRILLKCYDKMQFEIHDISGDGSHRVLKIKHAGAKSIGSCALNNDGSKAAFIVNNCKLYIVDVNREEGSISVSQLTPIDFPISVLICSLTYDTEDRLCVLGDGSLWLVEPSKSELVSLEKAEVPQGYLRLSSAISPNSDYIALLFQSKDESEKREYQYRMIVKRNTKGPFMRLCGYKS